MSIMKIVRWYDPDTCRSVAIAAEAYGIQVCCAEPTEDPNEMLVCVRGPTENVERFAADVVEDCIEPFESTRDMSDNEYQIWLAAELKRLHWEYVPKLVGDDDED